VSPRSIRADKGDGPPSSVYLNQDTTACVIKKIFGSHGSRARRYVALTTSLLAFSAAGGGVLSKVSRSLIHERRREGARAVRRSGVGLAVSVRGALRGCLARPTKAAQQLQAMSSSLGVTMLNSNYWRPGIGGGIVWILCGANTKSGPGKITGH
ncbi:hypothetical protein THAOC_16101, partial [Thalassiosira oceanica]